MRAHVIQPVKLRILVAAACAVLITFFSQSTAFAQKDPSRAAKRYIVVLKDSAINAPAVDPDVSAYGEYLSSRYGGNVRQVFSDAVRAYVSEMTSAQASRLAEDSGVLSVEEDRLMTLAAVESSAPWHLDRVDQRTLPLDTTYNYSQTASNVNIYILDTGVRHTHSDFGGRADLVYDNVGDGRNGEDCNGHGTHVAGLAASFTYGVAKAARLHSVRVVGCNGVTYMSNLLDGINWVTAHHTGPSVANISLQFGGGSFSLEAAIANSVASGVTYSVAAGNAGLDACGFTPAREPSAITVGATGSNDARASYSNVGPCVDVFAPGTGLTSLSNANDTDSRVLSGTSMASPVVAGIAALYLADHPSASATEVTNAIKSTASSGKLTSVDATTPNLLVYSRLGAANVKIRKLAQSVGPAPASTFNYSAVNLDSPSFSLTNNATYEDGNVAVPSSSTTISVTEAPAYGWILTGISCTEVSTGLPTVTDSTVNVATRTATIRAQPGEDITCNFTSQPLAPTAAEVTVSGRTLNSQGYGIRGVNVTFVNTRTGRSYTATSNSFGAYSARNLLSGDLYIVSVSNTQRLKFSDPVRSLMLYDALSDLDFVAETR